MSRFPCPTESEEPIKNSKVKLLYIDTVFEQFTDKDGIATFKSVDNKLPSGYEVSKIGLIGVKQDYSLDSVFMVKLKQDDSVSINQNLIACNNLIETDMVKTNYQSFKMNLPKGRFKIWFNFFNVNQKLDVYNGNLNNVSEKNLIYTTKNFQKGILSPYVEYESVDSTVTVCVTSSTNKASWVYKVYCARILGPIVPTQ